MPRKKPDKHYLACCGVRLFREGSLTADRKIVKTPEDVHQVMQQYFLDCPCEHFVVLLLSTKNHILAISPVSVGTLNASVVHPREVFQRAILANAASIILAHNHPSGDPTPSPEDIELTRRMVEAGKLLDIGVLDHVVVGEDSFASLKERGLL